MKRFIIVLGCDHLNYLIVDTKECIIAVECSDRKGAEIICELLNKHNDENTLLLL